MPPGQKTDASKDRVAVINEKLIRECVYIAPQNLSEDDSTKLRSAGDKDARVERAKAQAATVELYNVTCLMFSYKGIGRIANLVGVDRITKLHLDNNNIEKIENLGHLKCLEWLDLSFNRIREIEGLEELTRLQDLSLYSNQITIIKGLENLSQLSCLSLGRNCIENLEDSVKYLHKLHKSLRMVTLLGNKLQDSTHYRTKMLAFLPNLKFLDNRLILPSDIAKAKEEQRENLVPVDEEDKTMEDKLKLAAEEQAMIAEYKKRNCPNENTLFSEIYNLCPDQSKILKFLSEDEIAERIKDIMDGYQKEFVERSTELATKMKEVREKRGQDDTALRDTFNDVKARYCDKCKSHIKVFERKMKQIIPFGLKVKPDLENYDESAIQGLKQALAQLKSQLLEEEADQYEALGNVIAYAVQQYSGDGVENIFRENFETLQKAELDFQTSIRQKLDSLYEEKQKPDENEGSKAQLSLSKEEYQKGLAEWQELHRKRLEELEQFHTKREETIILERNEKLLRDEHNRNRTRVSEIHEYIQRMSDHIAAWEQACEGQ